jgi:hypothetical protein
MNGMKLLNLIMLVDLKKLIKMKNRFIKWFEINFGWFFINGRKQAAWAEYLRKKYENKN